MWSRKTSGIIGMVVGGGLFLANVRHVPEQGIVPIALPIFLFVAGLIYFTRAGKDA